MAYEILWSFAADIQIAFGHLFLLSKIESCNKILVILVLDLALQLAMHKPQVACLQTIILKFEWIKTQTSSLTLLPIALDTVDAC